MLNVDTMGISWEYRGRSYFQSINVFPLYLSYFFSIHSYAIFLTVLSQNVLQPFASPAYLQLADVSNHPAKDGVYR